MENPCVHTRSFTLRFCEMDGRGDVTPTALLNILEDAASTHCDAIGWGVYRLVSAGFGWVLLRGGLEMARYPAHGESFTVETWLSEAKRLYGLREYRIKSSSGEVLGYARSLWAFFSLERKRPAPILDEIVMAWAPEGTRAGALELGEVDFPADPELSALPGSPSFEVRHSDIDTNGHVNNVNYLGWALECLPAAFNENYYLASIRGQFRREVTYGSSVKAALAGPDAHGCMRHAVFASSAQGSFLAAAAESRWLPRALQAQT